MIRALVQIALNGVAVLIAAYLVPGIVYSGTLPRLLLGYAGWGEGQLMEEIIRNDWLTAPATSELIFSADPERIWDAALRSVGIDPANLPSWVPGATSEESAN